MNCINGRTEHPLWYPWDWNEERRRWERSCAVMGCFVWQWIDAIKVNGYVPWKAGKDHDHQWGHWISFTEDVSDGQMCYRTCDCGASEKGKSIEPAEVVKFFIADVGGSLMEKAPE